MLHHINEILTESTASKPYCCDLEPDSLQLVIILVCVKQMLALPPVHPILEIGGPNFYAFATPCSSISSANSPASNISIIMSDPPMNSPFT